MRAHGEANLGTDFHPNILCILGHGCPSCEDDDERCAPRDDEDAIEADEDAERGLEESPEIVE